MQGFTLQSIVILYQLVYYIFCIAELCKVMYWVKDGGSVRAYTQYTKTHIKVFAGVMETDISYLSTCPTSQLICSRLFGPWDTRSDYFVYREGYDISLRTPVQKTGDVDTTGAVGMSTVVT